MSTRETISTSSGNVVELINRDSDPLMWIVEESKKIAGFIKIKKKSNWYSSREDAMRYINNLSSKS